MAALKIDYSWYPQGLVTKPLLEEISSLYSNNYGVWSYDHPKLPGKRIQLSSKKIEDWFSSKKAIVALSRHEKELVGYAIAIRTKVKGYGIISWVTQFVVHEHYRNKGIGKTLLFSIWGFSNHVAWGILSSSPYAVRALEKATRRRCRPDRIAKNKKRLLNFGMKNVNYITDTSDLIVNNESSKANTYFLADHSELKEKIESVATAETPWLLGDLEEGWEWFAFTFNDQPQIQLTSSEIKNMLMASDQVTTKAYSRMSLDSAHTWASHTKKEVRKIIELCDIHSGDTVLDIGCGEGRHTLELSSFGLEVTGIDYVESFIKKAKKKANDSTELNKPNFLINDCRDIRLGHKFDAVICLYDVVGTYAENKDNLKILKSISRNLKPTGFALISVMNFELTERKAKYTFSIRENPNKLLDLPASNIMETTGNIFNPNFYIIDSDTNVVYRKEQFKEGNSLPAELIVRDKRYRQDEIEGLCEEAGLKVKWSRFVRAGDWDDSLPSDHDNAKEILILCEKP